MQTYTATQKGPLKIPGFIDPDDITTIQVLWGAPVFVADTVYRYGDICRPSVDNGYYYQCVTNGVTGSTEPTSWVQSTQISGTAEFLAVPYDLQVLPDQAITASTWEVTTGITLTNELQDAFTTSVVVEVTDEVLTAFTLTNRIVKSNGDSRDRTFSYKVRQQ